MLYGLASDGRTVAGVPRNPLAAVAVLALGDVAPPGAARFLFPALRLIARTRAVRRTEAALRARYCTAVAAAEPPLSPPGPTVDR